MGWQGRRTNVRTVVRNWSSPLQEERKSSVVRSAGGNGGNTIRRKSTGDKNLFIQKLVLIAAVNFFLMGTGGADTVPMPAISVTVSGGRKRGGRNTTALIHKLDRKYRMAHKKEISGDQYGSCFFQFARHGRALTGESPEQ